MSWRPIVRTWRKPLVVTSAVRAPLSSRIMLVATVVPCSTRSSSGAAKPASASASRTPVRKACEGSAGMLGVLARQIRPLDASCRAMSVKVPPISTAMANDGASDVLGEAVDIVVAMECAGCGPPGTKSLGGRNIDDAILDTYAIQTRRGLDADEAAGHILQNLLGRPVERMAMPAATAGLDTQHVAVLQHVAVRQGLELVGVIGAGIEDDAAGAAGHSPRHAPRRVLHAVDADRHDGFLGQHVVLAHDAAAAAILTRAAGVGEDAVGAQAHRIAVLQEF